MIRDKLMSLLGATKEERDKKLDQIVQTLLKVSKASMQLLYLYVFVKLFYSFVLRRESRRNASQTHVPTITHVTNNPYKSTEPMDSTYNTNAAYDQVVDYYGHYVSQTGLPSFPEFLINEERQMERLIRPTQTQTRRRR